jgi:hypothetical protein
MSNPGCGGCDEITLPLGQDGSDGKNAFTITTSSFLQPGLNLNRTINVSSLGQFSNAWASPGQIIFINDSSGNGGYYSVVSITGNNSIEIKNLGYPDNAALNIPILSGASVSPSGIRGANGSAGRNGVGLDGANGVNGTNGTTLLRSALGNGAALDTFVNIAAELTFTANELCALDGDKAVLEASVANSPGSGRGLTGEIRVLLDTVPTTGPLNISRYPFKTLEIASIGGTNGTLRLEIYRKSQTQASVTVTYIDSASNAISYISGASIATQFGGGLSLKIQGRLTAIPSAGESISCNTLTVSSFKQ